MRQIQKKQKQKTKKKADQGLTIIADGIEDHFDFVAVAAYDYGSSLDSRSR